MHIFLLMLSVLCIFCYQCNNCTFPIDGAIVVEYTLNRRHSSLIYSSREVTALQKTVPEYI